MKFPSTTAVALALASLTSLTFAAQPTAIGMEMQWETTGFSMPESAVFVPNHPWLYVSNVNQGKGPGFISRVALNGTIDQLKWVDGIQTPTGLAVFDGQLYVVAQTRVHTISLATGKVTQTFESADAKGLNDIAIGPKGQVFVSDLVGGGIYTIEGDKMVPWLMAKELPVPNGVLVQGDDLIVANWGSKLARELAPSELGALYRIRIADKSLQLLPSTDKLGTFDGLATLGAGVLGSNPMANHLYYFADGQQQLLATIEGGMADIGSNVQGQQLYAPLLFGNKLVAYKLSTEAWHRVTTKAEYLAQAADVRFGDAGGSSVANRDGRITGSFGGMTLQGSWDWQDNYFCRTSTLGDINLGHDCLVIELTPNQMRLTLEKGRGVSVIYDRQ